METLKRKAGGYAPHEYNGRQQEGDMTGKLYARNLWLAARASMKKMKAVPVDDLPCPVGTMQRFIHLHSGGKATIRTYENKFVVIDLSWLDEEE